MNDIMNIRKDKMDWKTREKAMSAIRNNKEVTPLQYRIMDTLVRCDEHKYKPTIKTLAAQFGIKERWLKYNLKELYGLGYLETIRLSDNNNNNVDLHVHPIPVKSGAF